MIDRRQLLADLKPLVRVIEDDLRGRLGTQSDYKAELESDWAAARAAGRTAEAFATWADAQLTQSAIAWLLACVFVRFCEDNGLIDDALVAGNGEHGQRAAARQEAFYAQNPIAADNDYLRDVFAAASKLPGLADVFRVQASPLSAPISADAAKRLVGFFRAIDADSGALKHDFADLAWNTRFLGDLYQDLSEAARDRYALLQTPEFVEEFILDRTLTPALDAYTLEEVDLIDPTCGSGHFVLGAFARLAPKWLNKEPGNANVAIQHALDHIAGIDLNPFAVAIARFRLLVAALKAAGVGRLKVAPDFHLRIAVGDSLLHGFDQRDHARAQTTLDLEALIQTPTASPDTANAELAHLYTHAFASEDLKAANDILSHHYAVVVGNPPYIAVKDRAVSALYRERYTTCHGKYALVAPFCERFWALAKPVDATERAGFVGLIVANSFMKREFGKKLVEDFFPAYDLTHVIDTSGAYIPGHGTPTVILFGRARPPAASVIRAVMGIKGEPETPADPTQGVVWQAILNQIDQRDSESDWVSVSDVTRATFAKHPWSIGGGGAAELKETIGANGAKTLGDLTTELGIACVTGEDDVYVVENEGVAMRSRIEATRRLVTGELVRDWSAADLTAVWLYDETLNLKPLHTLPNTYRFFWPYRSNLSKRKRFGTPMLERGLTWYEWQELYAAKLRTPLTISFAEVATHNHFVLDRGGKVFNRTAPVIKLPEGASEDDHLGLLGILNSSTACFWFKQVCHNKGSTVDQHGARQRTAAFEDFYALNSTKIGQFPIVVDRPIAIARTLDRLARERSVQLPTALLANVVPTRAELESAHDMAERLRRRMIAWQEELDWHVYRVYGVQNDDLVYPGELPEIAFGERAFEILLARDIAAGKASTTWFERHRAIPVTEIPAGWPEEYGFLVKRRIEAIRGNRDLALIERPECKRRWSSTSWAELERTALENWLLDRLEGADLWPRDAHPAPRMLSSRDMAEALAHDEAFRRALDLYAGVGSDAAATVALLVQSASVPFLDMLRYSETGLRKRTVWQDTWATQRQEDGIDAAVAREWAGRLDEEIAKEQKRWKAEKVGAVPVPPKYRSDDFRDSTFWKLRGALDVPKERFVSYPGLQRGNDAGVPLVLWAGYDAKARALALTTHIYELQQREGADGIRLAPALAGLDELLPWVHQWHPEIDTELGTTTGDYLQGLLDDQIARHGLTLDEVRAWAPVVATRVRRRRSGG